MSLPSTLTINLATPSAHDIVMGSLQISGNSATYVAPSAQADLLGQPKMKISHETSSKGVVRSLFQFVLPYFNSTTNRYEGNYTANLTLTRPDSLPVVGSQQALEFISDAISNNSYAIRDIIAGGRL
jgi:hypothetical protein